MSEKMTVEDLQQIVEIQRTTIRQLEQRMEKDDKINRAMTIYFDTLYTELLNLADQKDKELEKDHYIDRIMEMVYDNIHLAFDSLVKEKSKELENMQDAISHYDNYVHEVIHDRTKALSEENKKLQEIAMTDDLTGLSNRRGFLLFAEGKLSEARAAKKSISLFFIDLDEFKSINDKYGHDEGDWLLKKAAWVLHKSLRGDDLIARFGGDEFAVFMQTDDTDKVIGRIKMYIKEFNSHSDKDYRLALSVGYATVVPDDGMRLVDIIRIADKNMYENKASKKHSA
jgi:diguanylate cyclase (GGDEF)-like protein